MQTVTIEFTRHIRYRCIVTLNTMDQQLLGQSCIVARDNSQEERNLFNKLSLSAMAIDITPIIEVDTLNNYTHIPTDFSRKLKKDPTNT